MNFEWARLQILFCYTATYYYYYFVIRRTNQIYKQYTNNYLTTALTQSSL